MTTPVTERMKRALSAKDCCGSILIVVLLVLIAITILGVVSTYLCSIENRISSNRREVQEVFYMTESTVAEAIQTIVNSKNIDLEDKFHIWHHSRKENEKDGIDFRSPEAWVYDSAGTDNCKKSAFTKESFYTAVEWGVASGGSLVVTQPRLYMTRIYGLCKKHGENSLIEIGYYKRYGNGNAETE